MKRAVFLYSFIAVLLIVNVNSTTAQENSRKNHKDHWEKFKAEKVAFLTSNLNLTPAEAQQFWPVYNEMEKERWEAQKARRELETKVSDAEESLSDKAVIKLTRDFAGTMQKEANIMTRYNEEFLKILPPQKVLKLYKAENEFRMYMIKKFRDRKDHGKNDN